MFVLLNRCDQSLYALKKNMKFSIVLLFSIFSSFSFSQQRFTLLDKETKEPILNVNIQNANREIVAISNNDGEVFLEKINDSIYHLSCFGYKPKSLYLKHYSEILLEPTSTDIEEVTVSGMKNSKLYDFILNKTKHSIKNENSRGKLNYFISNYFIIEDTVLKTCDTMIIHSQANFFFNLIANENKTKREFEFIPIDAKRYQQTFKKEEHKQRYSTNPVFLKPRFNHFKSLFSHELSSTSRLELERNDSYASYKYLDSIPHLLFSSKDSRNDATKTAFYNSTDSTLLQYSLQGKNESGRYYIISNYNLTNNNIYFFNNAKEELVVKTNMGDKIFRTITVQIITIEDIERVKTRESFYSGAKIDPMDFILNTPLSETPFPVLLFPSK